MKIPFVDLKLLHSEIKEELRDVFDRVLNESTFVLGPEVQRFEQEFAAYVGTTHCVAVNTGTAAIQLALAALGIGSGDEVITVPHTFIATAEAITAVGARPVFIDIDPVSFTMNPALLEAAISSKTRAIIPVHIYGQVADMDRILEISNLHGIPVVEDACQAHGAEYKGRKAGAFGIAGCFSFYPGKNLGACGEGGAVTTDDGDLAQRIRLWRDHGSSKRYEHIFPGLNMRMDGLQGGILSVKLKYLDRWNNQRRQAAAAYDKAFVDTDIEIPNEMDYGHHVYHLYVVQTSNRDALRHQLTDAGIESGLHYPIPLHLQEAYRFLGYKEGDFPVAERVKNRILSLPMYPGIRTQTIERVVSELRESCHVG
ncbi:DegT/DnrJ/EryC1/StrS aminotransferase family protein [Granulicella sp. L60]|uniref:DegT/DnrJ/EryC1/StrS family aminotransferase n=1 Tax=Granulicella sp. L60 TaxID=1641866 RepID=UPI00131DD90C|nr:DegT/DnrJ/EryC1/StrS family aminotransferase [Granulicella sp. L60]